VKVHSLTLSYTLGSLRCDSWASLLAYTFVSPYLGCEPKAKVTTKHTWKAQYNKEVYVVFGKDESHLEIRKAIDFLPIG
jgi:hypothetical protein